MYSLFLFVYIFSSIYNNTKKHRVDVYCSFCLKVLNEKGYKVIVYLFVLSVVLL